MAEPVSAVRAPVCADNQWYPSRPSELRSLVEGLLAQVPGEALAGAAQGELLGLVAPHAGIRFSGPTAAYAYRLLAERRSQGDTFERVVLLGPSHFADYGPVATTDKGYFATPLGTLPIDRAFLDEIAARLAPEMRLAQFSRDREHSLEIELPFLQVVLGPFSLVPLLMSVPFYIAGLAARAACETLSLALTPLVRDTHTLLVASSDLSHLHDYESVVYFDRRLEMLLEEYDLGGLVDFMSNEEGEARACGDSTILTLLMTARALGGNKIVILHRTNSGDVMGMHAPGQYTVGYMAAAVLRVA